ncbi:hypothetical protein ACRAWD_19450 [Caulobacter segnis]
MGLDEVRAHFAHLLDTVRLEAGVAGLRPGARRPGPRPDPGRGPRNQRRPLAGRHDHRLVSSGPGLIVDQDVDDSGRDMDAPLSTLQTVLEEAYDAFNRRDLARIRTLMHPDVVWPDTLDGVAAFVGASKRS